MPPAEAWVAFIDRLPSVLIILAGIILLLILVVFLGWVWVGAKRFADAAGKENALIKCRDDLERVRESLRNAEASKSQSITALENISRLLYDLFTYLVVSNQAGVFNLLQRLVEGVAADVKHNPGEFHRCGFWIARGDDLTLVFASAGFPPSYVSTRKLNIHRSVAGRAFRKNETVVYNDRSVRDDPDWSPNPDSTYRYEGLICIPVREKGMVFEGVLTVDAKRTGGFSEEGVGICQAYAVLARLILTEWSRLLQSNASTDINGSGEVRPRDSGEQSVNRND